MIASFVSIVKNNAVLIYRRIEDIKAETLITDKAYDSDEMLEEVSCVGMGQ